MKITFEDKSSEYIFRVSNFNKKYIPVFDICFWQNDEDSYIKKFPADSKHLKLIKDCFLNNAEEMFNQLGYFSECKWQEALDAFAGVMHENNIDWWLTGSCALCIRGIELKPHDVDIMVNSSDIEKIKDVFANKTIIPIIDTQGWLTKDFGVIFWYARIDIASDPSAGLDDPEPIDCGPYAAKNLEKVEWRGHTIKAPPVNLTLTVNKKRERWDRVKLIEEYLKQN